MKKALALFLILCFIPCCGCSLHYGEKTITKDYLTYYQSSVSKVCFAGCYEWDGKEESTTITIPDEVDGYKVTKLGGYIGRGVPTPFYIDFSNVGSYYYGDIPDNAEIITYHFTLNIGKNLNEIQKVVIDDYFKINDTEQYARLCFTVNCHKDNKHFYSEDGRLYNKKDNTLITDFNYFNNETNDKTII